MRRVSMRDLAASRRCRESGLSATTTRAVRPSFRVAWAFLSAKSPRSSRFSRRTQRPAAEEVGIAASTRRDLQWEVVHSCGHMLVSEIIGPTNGSEFVWWYLDPCLLFVFVLENNAAVADVVVQRLFRSGGSMQLIYTADATFSGNPLHESGRKAWCVNFSIKEIPFAFRSQSAFWCCPAVCRTKHLRKSKAARLD